MSKDHRTSSESIDLSKASSLANDFSLIVRSLFLFFLRATRCCSCCRVNYTDSRRFSVPPGAIAEYQSTKKRYFCDTSTWTQSVFFPLNFVDPVNGYNYSIKGLNLHQRRLLYPPKRPMFSLIGLLFSFCLVSASCWNSWHENRLIKNMSNRPDKRFQETTKKIKVKTVIKKMSVNFLKLSKVLTWLHPQLSPHNTQKHRPGGNHRLSFTSFRLILGETKWQRRCLNLSADWYRTRLLLFMITVGWWWQ